MERDRGGIVEVEDRDVLGALPGEEIPLRGVVGGACVVDVQVILAGERHDRHLRAAPERLELERGELEHNQIVRAEPVHLVEDGVADVAAEQDVTAGRLEHRCDERGGRRLPLRAGDPDDRRGAEPEEELHLAPHRHAALGGTAERRRVGTHAGDPEDEVGLFDRRGLRALAERERDVETREPGAALLELRRPLRVGDRHPRAVPQEEPHERDGGAPLAQADDRDVPPRELVGSAHTGVANARIAATMPASAPMSQKRIVTFTSGQPMSSK